MLSYSQFLNQIANKETTCLEFTQSILNKIEELKDLNTFITVLDKEALLSAQESDKRFESGKPRPLEGMIVAIKDNISTKGVRTTCASKMLENYEPIYDATVIQRLKNAGAIIIGKTNMDEFAMGSSNETSYFGLVGNPHNSEYVPGGSSGGSAASVAAGFCHTALGSDTGGSVRQPASFTGTFGFKPSYGVNSRYGLVAFASSLDQIGVFASGAEDIARVMDVISGEDVMDATCSRKPSLNSFDKIDDAPTKLTFGILPQSEIDKCSPEIISSYNSILEKFKSLGIQLKEVNFTNTDAWIPTYYILATAECSSNLSRFDGIRFGFRPELKQEDNIYVKVRSQGFGEEVKRRIMIGTYVLSSGYYDAYYTKAQKTRRVIADNYAEAFKHVDFIFLPATPTVAFKKNEKKHNPLSMYLSDFFTVTANLAGIPAITIPAGFTDQNLPYGVQLQAKQFDDERLLSVSNYIHQIISK